ncbi:MAG: cytochrome c biogenesis protein CcsA [Gemmatimonadota bacterium]
MITTLSIIAVVLYGGAELVYAGSLAGGRRAAPRAGSTLVALAVILHGLALGMYAARFGELPLVGLGPSLSTFSFLVALTALGATSLKETRPLGLVLIPIVAVALIAALILGLAPAGEALAFRGVWFGLHVVLSFIGYAGLAVAFAAGLLYLLQFRELKGKHFGRMFRFFPSLETLDRLVGWGLLIGFPALTLGLIIGWGWASRFNQQFGADNPKVLWGVLTWVIFVVALGGRHVGKARDRRGALLSVVGFLLVVVAYVVLRLLMPSGRLFL